MNNYSELWNFRNEIVPTSSHKMSYLQLKTSRGKIRISGWGASKGHRQCREHPFRQCNVKWVVFTWFADCHWVGMGRFAAPHTSSLAMALNLYMGIYGKLITLSFRLIWLKPSPTLATPGTVEWPAPLGSSGGIILPISNKIFQLKKKMQNCNFLDFYKKFHSGIEQWFI